jgi:hypothetical protein
MRIKPLPVIAYAQKQFLAIDAKFHLSLSRPRMLHDIIDALFENQKHFTPQVRAQR